MLKEAGVAMSKEQRAEEWNQLAQAYARNPGGASSNTGAIVLLLLSASCLALGSFGIVVAYSPEVSTAEFEKVLIPSLALVGLGCVLVPIAAFMIWTARRESGRRDAFAKAAQDRQGEMLDGLGLARWLAEHWDDAYPHPSFLASPEVCRAALQVEGVHVLVDHTPYGYHMSGNTQSDLWWARVVVPAGPYSNVRVNPEHPQVSRVCERGYEISLGAGGIMARGTPVLKSARAKHPNDIFEIAPELVGLARSIDADILGSHGLPLTLAWDQADAESQRLLEEKADNRRLIAFAALLVVITVASWVASIAF